MRDIYIPEYITQNTSSDILPDGSEWEFVVEDAHEKESANHNEMIELQLRIITGSGKGPLIYDNLVFTEKAYWKIDQFLEATGDKLIPGQRVVLNADDCIDRHGHAVLKIDVFEGRSRNKIDYYVPPNELAPKFSQEAATTSSKDSRSVLKNELGEPVDPF